VNHSRAFVSEVDRASARDPVSLLFLEVPMTVSATFRGPFAASKSKRLVGLAALVAGASILGACSTAPLSYVYDRDVYYKATLHRYPVFLVSIDGHGIVNHPDPITPGDHVVVLNAQPTAGFSIPLQKTYPLAIAPCTRYYLAAQRPSPVSQDWDLVVEQTWPVSGCDPQKEIAKAREAVARGEQPPVTSFLETPAKPMRTDNLVQAAPLTR
jgi:hypothetical protein